MRHTVPSSPRCFTLPALLLALLCASPGCESYQPQPLELDTVRARWLARSPADESVRAFAASLGRTSDGSSFDPADGLTLSEAEVVALVYNPDLRQARLEAGVAQAAAVHAGLWQDPVLGIDLARVIAHSEGANPWVAGGTLGLTIPLSGRLEAEKARAGAQAAAALEDLAAREWATRAALRELWIHWSAARLHREIGARLVSDLRDVASLAEAQERAGSLSRLDARVFRVERALRESDQIALDARAHELEFQLRAMLGLAPASPVELSPTLAFPAPDARDADTLRAAMERSSPELAAVRARYDVAEQSLREQVRMQYPDLVLGPGYGRDQGDDRLLLGLELPIPLWNRNQRGIAEARAERQAARARFETTYEHLASRLHIALIRLDSGRAQRESIESAVVPLAQEQESDARRVAALGRVEPLLLLTALQGQHQARARLIDARAAEAIGAVRVAELLGPLPTPPPEPAPPADSSSPAASETPAP